MSTGVAFSMELPDGARVEFRVTSGALVKEGIALLRNYLDLVERSISAPTVTWPGSVVWPEPPSALSVGQEEAIDAASPRTE